MEPGDEKKTEWKNEEDVKYKGIGDCMKKVLGLESTSGFWKGNLCSCAIFFPNYFIDIGVTAAFNKLERSNPEWMALFLGLNSDQVSLIFAPTAALLFCQPIDVARTKLAADKTTGDNKKYKGFLDCLDTVSQKEGFFGFYRAFLISLAGLAIYRVSYDSIILGLE